MWMHFFLGCAIVLLELYVPGFIVLGSTGMSRMSALWFSPAMSVFLSTLVEMGILATGNTCSTILVGLLTVLFALVFASILSLASRRLQAPLIQTASPQRHTTLIALLSILVGLIAVGVFFVKGLDGPYSYFQGWDNTHHLSTIRYFADSGQWNPLFPNRYLSSEVSPYVNNDNTFYPSAWHILCATVVSLFDAPASLGVNCVNAVLLSIVFPLSVLGLLDTEFKNNRTVLLAGSLLAVGIAACPWDYVIYGPLFPNLFSTCLIPISMALFILLTTAYIKNAFQTSLAYLFLFGISLVSVAIAHPNGIFTLLLVLAPFLTHQVLSLMKERGLGKAKRYLAVFSLWILIGLFWILCFRLPFFQSVVTVVWPSIKSLTEAILDLFLLSLVNHPAQPYVALLLLLGLIGIALQPSHRWLLGSLALAATTYVLDAGTDIPAKSLITGFWYTDYHRTGAMYGFIAVLISIYGLSVLITLSKAFISKALTYHDATKSKALPLASFIVIFIYVVTGVIVYFPGYDELGIEQASTAFGYQYREFANQNDSDLIYYDILTSGEEAFCKQVSTLVNDEDLIINDPNDGSIFAYQSLGLNLFYRNCLTPDGDNETTDSKLIRESLASLSTSYEVRAAVSDIGATYVLQLDSGDNPEEFRINYGFYNRNEWIGINSINEHTPGFTLVLAEDDMRLYRIDPN